jgi:hypothetical protein
MDDLNSRQDINKYKKFKKVDGATYRKVNMFLRKRTYITAREWALARLCTDFRTSGGAEMTYIGQHLPELVPFMEDTYTPQAVNQARNAFKKKVRKSSATFFYGAMCGFFTTDELDDLLFEASEVARFLLEVEGTTLDIDEEIDIEDRITRVMRGVGEAAKTLLKNRNDGESMNNQPERVKPTTAATGCKPPAQGHPGSMPDNGLPEITVAPDSPDQSEPEYNRPPAVGPANGVENPDEPFVPGEDQKVPASRGISGTDAPTHPIGDKIPDDGDGTQQDPFPAIAPTREDP